MQSLKALTVSFDTNFQELGTTLDTATQAPNDRLLSLSDSVDTLDAADVGLGNVDNARIRLCTYQFVRTRAVGLGVSCRSLGFLGDDGVLLDFLYLLRYSGTGWLRGSSKKNTDQQKR